MTEFKKNNMKYLTGYVYLVLILQRLQTCSQILKLNREHEVFHRHSACEGTLLVLMGNFVTFKNNGYYQNLLTVLVGAVNSFAV